MTRPAASKTRAAQLRQAIDDGVTLSAALEKLTIIMKGQAQTIEELRKRCAHLDESVGILEQRCKDMATANVALREKVKT